MRKDPVVALSERRLRRRVRRLLRELGIQPPMHVSDLCQRLGEHRNRPIRLVAWDFPVPGPFGLWISRADDEVIFYQKETTRVHQDHIILHEIGHILADHHDGAAADAVFAVPPAESPHDSRDLLAVPGLRRTCYAQETEREAELVATIIQQWAMIMDDVALRTGERGAGALATALSPRWGWL